MHLSNRFTRKLFGILLKLKIGVFFVLGMVAFIPSLAMFIEQGVMGVISAVQVLMQAYAIYLLFNADSKAWLASKVSI